MCFIACLKWQWILTVLDTRYVWRVYSKPLFSAEFGKGILTPQGGEKGENLFDLFQHFTEEEIDRGVVGT